MSINRLRFRSDAPSAPTGSPPTAGDTSARPTRQRTRRDTAPTAQTPDQPNTHPQQLLSVDITKNKLNQRAAIMPT